MEVENVAEVSFNGDKEENLPHGGISNDDGIKKPNNTTTDLLHGKRKGKKVLKNNRDLLSGAGLNTPDFVAPQRRWKNSRRSRTGYGRGLPKKGGAGGKGVWGIPGSEILEEDMEDQNDPNYEEINEDNVELKEVIPEMTSEEFIKQTEPIILEYFENGDTSEVANSIDEYLTSAMRPMVTYVAVEVALDHKQSQREMTSVLISDLYGRIITGKDIQKGS